MAGSFGEEVHRWPSRSQRFLKLEEARKWIFGEAHKEKAIPGAMIELKEKAGMVAFELSAAELHESAGALKELEKAGYDTQRSTSMHSHANLRRAFSR